MGGLISDAMMETQCPHSGEGTNFAKKESLGNRTTCHFLKQCQHQDLAGVLEDTASTVDTSSTVTMVVLQEGRSSVTPLLEVQRNGSYASGDWKKNSHCFTTHSPGDRQIKKRFRAYP